MNTIERVKELLKDEVVENVVDSRFLCGGVADVVCVRDVELLLDSLASERCVWNVEKTDDVEFLRPSCRESQCYVEFRSKAEWFKGCPFCLKRIEVKEVKDVE